jgi:hypothetical protein
MSMHLPLLVLLQWLTTLSRVTSVVLCAVSAFQHEKARIERNDFFGWHYVA